MTAPLRQVELVGDRVVVRRVDPNDAGAYRAAVLRSAARIGEWNPVEPDAVPSMVAGQGSWWWSFLAFDRETGELAAKVNLSNIVPGRFRSGSLGYDSYDPYAGTGRLAEALSLIIDFAFAPLPDGLGLHRLEAVVQPGNTASAGLLRRLGFQLEGRTPRMLWLGRPGEESWRDHDRYAITTESWPGRPYEPPALSPRVVLVNGLPGAGKTSVAGQLAAELGLPLLAKDVIKESLAAQLPRQLWDGLGGRLGGGLGGQLGVGELASELLWDLLAVQPEGAVVESFWWDRRDRELAERGLRRAGHDPRLVPELWCQVPWEVAYERFVARAATSQRHEVHATAARPELLDRDWWQRELGVAGPLGLGPTVELPTATATGRRDVVRAALQLRALWHGAQPDRG